MSRRYRLLRWGNGVLDCQDGLEFYFILFCWLRTMMRDSGAGERGQSIEQFKISFTCLRELAYSDVFVLTRVGRQLWKKMWMCSSIYYSGSFYVGLLRLTGPHSGQRGEENASRRCLCQWFSNSVSQVHWVIYKNISFVNISYMNKHWTILLQHNDHFSIY